MWDGPLFRLQCRPTSVNYIGCRFTIVSNSKLPQWPIKQYIPVTPHVWLIWSSGTLHPEIYGLPLPTFCLLLVVTSHLVLEVFARQLLLSGIYSLPSNVCSCETLTAFRRHLKSHLFHSSFATACVPSQRLWFVHDHGALFTYLAYLTDLRDDTRFVGDRPIATLEHAVYLKITDMSATEI